VATASASTIDGGARAETVLAATATPTTSVSTSGGRAYVKTVSVAASASTSGRGAYVKTVQAPASASTSGKGVIVKRVIIEYLHGATS